MGTVAAGMGVCASEAQETLEAVRLEFWFLAADISFFLSTSNFFFFAVF